MVHTCTHPYHLALSFFATSKGDRAIIFPKHRAGTKDKTLKQWHDRPRKTTRQEHRPYGVTDCSVVRYRSTQQSGPPWMLLMTGVFWHFILRMEKENHQHLKRRILRNAALVVQSQMPWSKAYYENVDASMKTRTEHPLWIFSTKGQTTRGIQNIAKFLMIIANYCLQFYLFVYKLSFFFFLKTYFGIPVTISSLHVDDMCIV